jgi:rubrerythrin
MASLHISGDSFFSMVWRIQKEKRMKYLLCENCHEVIASFEMEDIAYPVTGEMFQSKFAPEKDMLPPWIPGTESAWLKCPICRKRVFHNPNPKRLRVSDYRSGLDPHLIEIVQPELNQEVEKPKLEGGCPKCGKPKTDFKNIGGYMGHVRYCKGKR